MQRPIEWGRFSVISVISAPVFPMDDPPVIMVNRDRIEAVLKKKPIIAYSPSSVNPHSEMAH